jgi:cytochrome P450
VSDPSAQPVESTTGTRRPASAELVTHPDALPRNLLEGYRARFTDMSKPLDELAAIEDPAFWVNPYPVYERMQAEAPAFYYEPLDTWILTRFADVQNAARSFDTFSAQHGILLYDGRSDEWARQAVRRRRRHDRAD